MIGEHVITLEVAASGDPTALLRLVETACDQLMADLLGDWDLIDPSVSLAVAS